MLRQVISRAGQVLDACRDTVDGIAAAVSTTAGEIGVAAAHAATPRIAVGDQDGRAHFLVRGIHRPEARQASARLEQRLGAREGIIAVETNRALGSVLLSYDPAVWDRGTLSALVAEVERECGLGEAPWSPAASTHPGNPRALLRGAVGVGVHLAGLGYATMARALPIPPVGVVGTTLSLIDSAPRLRGLLEASIGATATDALISVTSSAAHTVTRQPLAVLTDLCQRYTQYQELSARQRAWLAWDRALADREGAHREEPMVIPPRPAPLPEGPVERTARRCAMTSFGVAGALWLTPARRRTGAALAAGVPRAAKVTQEAFAARLIRDAAATAGGTGATAASRAGCLVLDASAVRRLDRVDTVLLDHAVLFTGRRVIDTVLPLESGSSEPEPRADEVFARAHDLVDPRDPAQPRAADGWSVAPLTAADDLPALPVPDRQLADRLARRLATDQAGEGVLVLRRRDRPVALVTLVAELNPLAEALVTSAARAGTVLVRGEAGGTHEAAVVRLARRLPIDGTTGGGELLDALLGLQRDGRVVAVVAREPNAALAAADLGIGLADAPGVPPWGAHLICAGVAQACRLLNAGDAAKRASRYGARLTVAGAALGGLLALIGPARGASRRASIPVYTAALLGLGTGWLTAMSVDRLPPPLPSSRLPWHAMSAQAVLSSVASSPNGLSESEARRRKEQSDEHDTTSVGLGRATLEELANPLTPVLAAGAGISAGAGSILDPLLISVVLVLNALIGGVQRLSAQRELRRLTARSTPRVRVRRGQTEGVAGAPSGARHDWVKADALAVGDVVELQAGDAVPADCRLVAAHDLQVDESTLTGESATVAKSTAATLAATVADRRSMLFEGTVIAAGRAVGVVVATGDRTEVGRTKRIGADLAPSGGVAARLRTLTRQVLPFSLAAGIALAVVDVLRARGFGQTLSRAVGLAVAAVPEGLPFVATVAELAAARRLSARGALVRNPATIEALGRVDVLCFDKTGTLTEGRLGVRQVSDGTHTAALEDLSPELSEVLASAVRASPFAADEGQVPHQTDRAVLRDAERVGVTADHHRAPVRRIHELVFDSDRGYHATLWREFGDPVPRLSVKGAPEVVLPLVRRRRRRDGTTRRIGAKARRRISSEVDRLARQGYRVLAVAERACPGSAASTATPTASDVTDLEFRGLLALADPVRPAAARAVATLRAAGVRIVMITGDHPSTAESIAAELNAVNGRRIVTGADLDELTDEQLDAELPSVAVFARVTPEHKARIVRRLRAIGRTVAVTGDGANDAPAIRLADVGLALGKRATSAAREAADVVITDNRIETITDAIVEGRAMWSSVRDALSILLGGNLGEIAYALGTGLLNGGEALNARQLLLINMLTDVLPAMAVAVRPPPDVTEADLLAEGPEASLGTALTRDMILRAAITAVAAGVAWLVTRPVASRGQASTTGMVALVGAQLGQTLVVRGRTPLVVVAVAGSLLLLGLAVQVPGVSHLVGCRPLLPHQWAIAIAAAAGASVAQLAVNIVIPRLLPLREQA